MVKNITNTTHDRKTPDYAVNLYSREPHIPHYIQA